MFDSNATEFAVTLCRVTVAEVDVAAVDVYG